MTKVGFITSPLVTGHAIRGVGFYTQRLLAGLKSHAKNYKLEIVENGFDCEVVHFPFFDLFNHTLPIFKRSRTVVTIHDVIPLEFPQRYPAGIRGTVNLTLQKLALVTVDRIITDSYASLIAIRNHLNVDHQKLKLVYLAAAIVYKPVKNKALLARIKNKYRLPDKFVLYVGDINWNKNIPGLIQACHLARLPLVIIGKNALKVDSLDLTHPQLRHLRGIKWEGVHRLGFVPDADLVVIYNLAKVYCQPSFAEGFGLPVLEAMACGTAVACSKTHSLPEIAGYAATYFDPANIQEIATSLLHASTSGTVVQASKFSWDKTAGETLQVYKELS